MVQSFKLLGITIDNKLNFSEHISITKKIINRKIFSIKRLFYLSTAAKIQFFKTFIMPYFDYCSSLLLYYPKSSISKLKNCFNLCLFKLFKFQPDFNYQNEFLLDEELDKEKIMSDFSNKLNAYGLCTYQKRLLDRFLLFTHSLLSNSDAPQILLDSLKQKVSEPNDSEPEPEILNLRSGARIKSVVPETKYGNLTTTYFFNRFIEKVGGLQFFKLNIRAFRLMIDRDFAELLRIFVRNFSKFDFSYFTNYKRSNKPKKKNH